MSIPDVQRLMTLVAEVEAASAPEQVVTCAVAALDSLRNVEEMLSRARDAAICSLHESGESLQQIRERTGLSRARLHQIIHAAI